jgi:hypothetical protein
MIDLYAPADLFPVGSDRQTRRRTHPFDERKPQERVVTALDTINVRYGLNTVYLGSI